WAFCVVILPITFVLTIPLSLVLHRFKHWVSQNPLLAWVNHFFVKDYGYLWFTLLYFGYLFTYQQHNRIPYDKVATFLRNYGVNTVVCLVTNVWCFGPLVFERINIATGGHCEGQGATARECQASGGRWIDGFDSSGHYYLITSISLMLVSVVRSREVATRDEESTIANGPPLAGLVAVEPSVPGSETLQGTQETIGHRSPDFAVLYRRVLWYTTITVLIMWYWMFLVTSMFFHTIPERVVGLLVGLAVPVCL
ncbi:uncharacterized protein CANTADRAFT_32542, partial [Suhomyces tanzawaensis NRRL Y-17324]